MKDKKHTLQAREKISRATRGINNPFYGKNHSKEAIEKMREAGKKNGGENHPMFGKKHSEETKKTIGLKSKGRCAGEKSNFWKGGNSQNYKTRYYSTEYKQWRIKVFERDGFRCQICKVIGGYLTAHHIKSFAHYPKLRLELDNGVTLCGECHELTDNYKGRGKRK